MAMGFSCTRGPDKTPYSSIRLEVIRDGIEDYEYLALLERLIDRTAQLPSARRPGQPVLDQAERLCHVPDSISRSMTEFTKRPSDVRARRRAIADMLDRLWTLAGVVDP